MTLKRASLSNYQPFLAPDPNAVIVRVLYGSITVHLETLDCSKGARVYYGPLHCRDVLESKVEERLFGPLEAQQLPLSPRHPASLAREIFKNFKRGLILEVKDESIFATALCRTVVYYGQTRQRFAQGGADKGLQLRPPILPVSKVHHGGAWQPP